jgi:uncharacterized coiled-coil protein SlyX
MDLITQGNPTPPNGGEPTLKKTVEELEAELAERDRTIVELNAQKDHYKEKYERDIVKAVTPTPPADSPPPAPIPNDVDPRISALEGQVALMQREKTMESILQKHPQIKERMTEFSEFISDPKNAGIALDRVATLFVAENNLSAQPAPKRPGLEKPTGGAKPTPIPKLSAAEIKRIRENEPRRYEKMIREGSIKPEDIS